MNEADDLSRRWSRVGVFVTVALLHVAAIFGLIHAFAPELAEQVAKTVLSSFSVTVETPPPPPKPAPKAAGAEGAAGKRAVPKEAPPKTKLPISPKPAPQASSSGAANSSGVRDDGEGTGGGRQGSGIGAGGSGLGSGGGQPTKPVHISGAINDADAFPIPPGGRQARIGKSVIVALTISPAGRAVACRVYTPSGFPESDQIVCRLAMQRLRFKPATNGAGEPVIGTFYWRQRFFS